MKENVEDVDMVFRGSGYLCQGSELQGLGALPLSLSLVNLKRVTILGKSIECLLAISAPVLIKDTLILWMDGWILSEV